jgi:hypothetical protein
MRSEALSVEAYLEQIPEDRKTVMKRLHNSILKNLPKGFIAEMNYGMVGYVVPHSIYPTGYHCDPKLPLPFMSLASQKNFVAIYHMGLYADQKLMDWFLQEYKKYSIKKPDMGKSCIRFKNLNDLPIDLIADLSGKVTVDQWIQLYESAFKK